MKAILKERGISSEGYKRDELLILARNTLSLYDEKQADDEQFQSAKRVKLSFGKKSITLPDQKQNKIKHGLRI